MPATGRTNTQPPKTINAEAMTGITAVDRISNPPESIAYNANGSPLAPPDRTL